MNKTDKLIEKIKLEKQKYMKCDKCCRKIERKNYNSCIKTKKCQEIAWNLHYLSFGEHTI